MPAATFTMHDTNSTHMLHPQERTAILILTGILIVLAGMSFVIESTGKEPFAAPFSDTLEDGTLAVLTGTVTAAANTRTGGHLMLSVDNTSVFVPDGALEDPDTVKGEVVSVIGIVQTYRGKKEIVAERPDDIVIQPQ
ncbi:hypothetical protein L1S32_10215 [Methanogenium sp. S4BF]|uniref:hypothetical protein n=1 Tax=Methanogenium sp. S4BF TaxID=1789226 RepID=UPI002415E495|nr:hypothetical protein [Methanogenium sp. S4BF]WFN34208.1 hypothetical protein L1S32_10215 [Methanogenium sp. S4BF]